MHSWVVLAGVILMALPARAEFIITSAIVEFHQDSARQQDIEIVSRSATNDYVVSEVFEVPNPGRGDEGRKLLSDPASAGLLVTPDKTILSAGNRKVLRFVLLKEPDDKERIYRVVVKPVINGVEHDAKLGLKVLVGYEVLVIVRPAVISPSYEVVRSGRRLRVANNGNTNVIFQNGQQCAAPERCTLAPVLRVYAGDSEEIELPADQPVSYSVWDGKQTSQASF